MSDSVRPGNREKGWNDPPEFLHNDSSLTGPAKTKTLLNKRVPHALNGLGPNQIQNETAETNSPKKLTEPPVFFTPPISKPAEVKPTEPNQNSTDSVNPSEISIEELENILNSSVQTLKDNQLAAKTCEDILKRVKIFVTNWPKLNDNVKLKMNQLVKSLEKNELNTANDIHLRLILDYPSEVTQWMVGFKKLIHELINVNEKEKEKKETDGGGEAASSDQTE